MLDCVAIELGGLILQLKHQLHQDRSYWCLTDLTMTAHTYSGCVQYNVCSFVLSLSLSVCPSGEARVRRCGEDTSNSTGIVRTKVRTQSTHENAATAK